MNGSLVRAIAVFACLVSAAVFMANARGSEAPIVRTTFASFPMKIDGWEAVNDPPMEKEILAVLGVDDYLSRAYYRPDGAGVGLYMGFYGSQRQGDTIHSPLNCLPGAGWEPLSEGRKVLADAGGPGVDIEVNRYVVQKGLDRQLVLYWYQARGRVVASEYKSRALLIGDAIRFNRTDGSMIRVITPIPLGSDGADAERLATEFVLSLYPLLAGYIPS
ncbi:MAG: EpsI family protein [Acidobacteriota bacterium]|nr:EpsI family protein [Acidobacteriota bacterium]